MPQWLCLLLSLVKVAVSELYNGLGLISDHGTRIQSPTVPIRQVNRLKIAFCHALGRSRPRPHIDSELI